MHFLIRCTKLEEKRDPTIIGGAQMTNEDKSIHILFWNKNHQDIAKMKRNTWNLSKKMRDDLRPP